MWPADLRTRRPGHSPARPSADPAICTPELRVVSPKSDRSWSVPEAWTKTLITGPLAAERSQLLRVLCSYPLVNARMVHDPNYYWAYSDGMTVFSREQT